MKKIILIIVLVLCFVTLGYCQGQPLKLTIKTDKQVYLAGEEADIKCDLTNVSKEEIIVCVYGLGRPYIGISLDIIDSKGNNVEAPQRMAEYMLSAPRKADFKILKSNESTPFIINNPDFDNYSYIPTKSGKYFITIYYSNDRNEYDVGRGKKEFINAWIGTAKSNTIAIQVIENKALKSISE